jgi:Transposase DNA-binding
MASWVDEEMAGCKFADARLDKRFRTFVKRLAEGMGETIPMVCQDWANTKAAYRFLSNGRVSEAEILAGHFESARNRFRATDGLVLILHDTTKFSFHRKNAEAIGMTKMLKIRKGKYGGSQQYPLCGILRHSSLVVTTGGLPLGMGT